MQCLHPISVKTSEFPIPCGKCPACLANKRLEWVNRLKAELEVSAFALFVTFTYDNEHLPLGTITKVNEQGEELHFLTPQVRKRDLQLFLKRLRKTLPVRSLRYFICSEYGDRTWRPHYHGVLFFNFPKEDTIYDKVSNAWQNGNVQFGDVEPASIAYVTKYIMKPKKGDFKCFILCSRHPALGSDKIMRFAEYQLRSENISSMRLYGHFVPTPRVFRDKFKDMCPDDLKIKLEQQTWQHMRERAKKRDKILQQRGMYHEVIQNNLKGEIISRHVKKQNVF